MRLSHAGAVDQYLEARIIHGGAPHNVVGIAFCRYENRLAYSIVERTKSAMELLEWV